MAKIKRKKESDNNLIPNAHDYSHSSLSKANNNTLTLFFFSSFFFPSFFFIFITSGRRIFKVWDLFFSFHVLFFEQGCFPNGPQKKHKIFGCFFPTLLLCIYTWILYISTSILFLPKIRIYVYPRQSFLLQSLSYLST